MGDLSLVYPLTRCAIFMATIDSSIVTLSLKVLQDAFHTNLGTVSWVVLASPLPRP
jgi:hypothetical protein